MKHRKHSRLPGIYGYAVVGPNEEQVTVRWPDEKALFDFDRSKQIILEATGATIKCSEADWHKAASLILQEASKDVIP